MRAELFRVGVGAKLRDLAPTKADDVDPVHFARLVENGGVSRGDPLDCGDGVPRPTAHENLSDFLVKAGKQAIHALEPPPDVDARSARAADGVVAGVDVEHVGRKVFKNRLPVARRKALKVAARKPLDYEVIHDALRFLD